MLYNDFAYHPKWRLIKAKTGVAIPTVVAIIAALFNTASKNRKNGWVGNFDVDICASAFEIPREEPIAVWRVLIDLGWLDGDYIVDWADRQATTDEDEEVRRSNRERQQRKRERDRAKKNVDLGVATDEEAAALERLAALSRVTAAQDAAPKPVEVIKAFEPIRSTGRDREADMHAERETQAAARRWLFGNGLATDLGIASAIIAETWGIKRLSADTKLVQWAKAIDAVMLAMIVSDAYERQPQLTRANFRVVVSEAIDRAITERASGFALPFGPTRLRGGGAA